MTTLSDLPPELVLEILKFVPIQDVYSKFRYTSSKLYSIVDLLKVDSLTALGLKFVTFSSRLKYFDLIVVENEDSFLETCPLRFKGIKKLTIKLDYDFLLKPSEFLNQFTELEELCVGGLNDIDVQINLKKLRKFSSKSGNALYEMNCPELCDLTLVSISDYNLHFPEKIKTLRFKAYGSEEGDKELILKLINLEVLVFDSDIWLVDNELLERLPNLKRVEVKCVYANNKQDVTYRRDGLKLLFNGIDADHFNQIMDRFDLHLRFQIDKEILGYIIENYDTIEEMDGYYHCHFDEIEHLIDQLPEGLAGFFNKVKKISGIIVNIKGDETKLLEFLQKSESKNLNAYKMPLSLSFFKQLKLKNINLKTLIISIYNQNNQNNEILPEEFNYIFQIQTLEILNLEFKYCHFYFYTFAINFLINAILIPNNIKEFSLELRRNRRCTQSLSLAYWDFEEGSDEFVRFDASSCFYKRNNYSNFDLDDDIYFRSKREALQFLRFCKCKSNNTKDLVYLINKINDSNNLMIKKLYEEVKKLYIDKNMLDIIYASI